MPAWTRMNGLVQGTQADAPHIFRRRLGLTETMFYWDALFSGVSDTLQRVTAETEPSQALHIFSQQNIKRAWKAVKHLHPLIGASFREEDTDNVYFEVEEERLSALAPDEITFMPLQSDLEVQALVDKILNEPRTLSNELLAKIWVIYLPQRHGMPSVHQVLFHGAHAVYDGMAQNSIIRSFFDILMHPNIPEIYVPKEELEARLALLPAAEDLYPGRKYTVARQRWRRAIARIIFSSRQAALKGGHTLPRTITPQTFSTPVVSRTLRVTLPKDVSRRVIDSCRKARITLGQALPVLAQVSHARILHRLRLQRKISDEDWEYRIQQPMHMGGPANLRPYMDPHWVRSGGADRVCVAISYYGITLPFLPTLRSAGKAEPEFGDLLSRARFFHRCHGPNAQMVSYMKHPLLTEFAETIMLERIPKIKTNALAWRAQQGEPQKPCDPMSEFGQVLPVKDECIRSNACSSFGNMDNMIPPDYPMKNSRSREGDSNPRSLKQTTVQPMMINFSASYLRITSMQHYLRCRPTEFYLTSISYAGEIQFVLFCDVGVYEENLAMQWLEEVGRGAEWYLGPEETRTAKL